MDFLTLKDMDLRDKKVIVRVGFDLPVDDDGNITDDKRIKISVPTIKYILGQEPKQIILMCHMGRPKGQAVEKLKTNKAAEKTAELLGEEVTKIDDWGENGLPDSKIVFLENLRFNKAEKSKDADERDNFGKQLASLADVYVNDAFSNCHRAHASMTSVPQFISGCVGLSVEKEVTTIENTIENPEKPVVAIIGGLKADKLNTISNLLPKVDKILIGGALAFALLKEQGIDVGKTKLDSEGMESSKGLVTNIKENPKVILPIDAIIADQFDENAKIEIVSVDQIKPEWMALDIGPETIKTYKEELEKARTILWFGPMGVFEMEKFSDGTKEIAKILEESSATTIIGGGDSANAVEKFSSTDKMSLVSTGGGASLTLIEGKSLVAIGVLEENKNKFNQ